MPRKPRPQVPVRQHQPVVTTMYFPHHQTTMPPTTTVRDNHHHSIMSSILPSTTKKKGKKTQTITHPPLLMPMPEAKHRDIPPPHHHHSTDHPHRNWRLSHDIHECRRKVFQQIIVCLYQMMNVEEVALRYENIFYDGAYSQYDYEDMNSLPERVQHLFTTDAAPRFHHDLASLLEFSLQNRPLARSSMERALSLSSSSSYPSKPTQPDQPQGGGKVNDERKRGTSLEASYQTTSLPDNRLPTVTEMEPDDTADDDDVDIDNEIDAIINQAPSEDCTFGMDDDIPDDNCHHKNNDSNKTREGSSSCPSSQPPAVKRRKYDDEDHQNAATKCDDQGSASTVHEGDIAATAKSSSLSSSLLPRWSIFSDHEDRHGAANANGGAGSSAVTPRHHGASATTILGSSHQLFTTSPSRVFHRNKRKSTDYHRSSTQMVMERKVQRLMELYHAARCPHNNNNDGNSQKCPHSKYCTDMKQLWTHIETCRNNFCTAKHCYTSRVVLAHYKACTNSICQICQPVRHYITSSSSSSTTSKSRITNSTNTNTTASMQKQQNHQNSRNEATASPPNQDNDDVNEDDNEDGHHTSRGPSSTATAANVATTHRTAAVAIASG